MTSDSTKQSLTQVLSSSVLRYLRLLIEDARLATAEKLTMLLSAVAFFALLVIVGVVALVFISIGIGQFLTATVAPVWAYTYIAGFYVLVFLALIIFRRALFVDPIARFISRLIVEAPKPSKPAENESDSK